MKPKNLNETQLAPFKVISQSMNCLATLSLPGTFVQGLKDCGVNERNLSRNELLGCIVTQPSGSQLAIETVYYDKKDKEDDGDLHIINFKDRTLTSYYRGWGTWTEYYGDQHHANKDFLRTGTIK